MGKEWKTIKLDLKANNVLEYYDDIVEDYKVDHGNELINIYDVESERLDQYIVKFIEEKTGVKNAKYEIAHIESNSLLTIEYLVEVEKEKVKKTKKISR